MLVIIDTEQETVTIRGVKYFHDLVNWEDYLDYEVIIEPNNVKSMEDYLNEMQDFTNQ